MRVLVLGADGYLGWPTMLYLSKLGYPVFGIDNYMKRKLCLSINEESLVPLKSLQDRVDAWNACGKGAPIGVSIGDITDYGFIKTMIQIFKPDTIVHYAEQPSGPYSMIGPGTTRSTLVNNLVGTANVAWAIKECNPNIHLIKLGTAGEWGTPNTDIPEGFFEFEYKGRKDTRLFPREAGSLYHTTKIMDTDMLYFYIRVWGLTVTDLMQGPVVGILTDEMENNPDLLTCFHYGECFGTIVNRFIVQAIAGYPLTVYGKGGQTRGYLNIKDTVQCIHLAADNPPDAGSLRVMNQMTETFSVNELAEKVKRVGDKLGYNTTIFPVDNPRVEKEEHYYNPEYSKLLDLGLEPHYLTDEVIEEMFRTIVTYKDRINTDSIFRGYNWR